MVLFYQQFEDLLLERMKELNSDDEVVMQNVKKNNGIELRGLCVRKSGESISPTIYVQNYFSEDTSEDGIDVIAKKIQKVIESSQNERKQFEGVDKLLDFGEVADKIFFTVVNRDKNEELLKEIPHRELLDLAVVYKIHVNMIEGSTGSIQIKNEFLKMWGVQEETLYQLAMKNTEKLFGTCLRGMNELLVEMCKGKVPDYLLPALEEDNLMYVSTNDEKCYGAGAIFLNKGFREEVHDKIGDFIIIPSSVHETILLPYDESMESSEIRKMISQVNEEQLDATEVLSENVYFYKDNELQIMN